MTDDELLVTMRDMRTARYCSRGVRAFFESHGLDWGRFLREGIPARDLLATGDEMCRRVVEVARGRQ